MTGDHALDRQARLTALHDRLLTQRRAVEGENRALIQAIVDLVHELDPIRRRTVWPAKLITYIGRAQEWRCPACGKDLPPLNARRHHIDHVIPWSLGGGNEPSNVQILHASCNLTKGQRCDTDELIRYFQGRLLNL